ncbi:MAG: hypothetical protein BWY89_01209 [Bacteroidetes bacterium ADurb.BinA012]|nr:MAG: hypothetical protein BWY89_01209 [Bacteroidetes bacterium ADurb.BinA012]
MLQPVSNRMELDFLHHCLIAISCNFKVHKKHIGSVDQSAESVLVCIKMKIFLLHVHHTWYIILCPQAVCTLLA